MENDRDIFTKEITGKEVYKRRGEAGRLNKNDTSIKDRINNVEDFLADGFFETYFDEYYNPNINQNDALSDENSVSIALQKAADYLIQSEESREMSKSERNVYVFTVEDFNKKTKRHENMYLALPSSNNDTVDVNYVTKPKQPVKFKRYNKYDLQDVYSHNDPELTRIVNEYLELRDKYSELRESNPSYTAKYNLHISLIDDDIEEVVKSYTGMIPRGTKTLSTPKKIILDEIDYSKEKDFRMYYTTPMATVEYDKDLWENTMDFRNTLNETKSLTDYQRALANLYMHGWTTKQINNDVQIYNPIMVKHDEVVLNRLEMRKIQRKVLNYLKDKE